MCFSDAGFPHPGENKKVAQEGCVFGVSFGTKKGSKFHTLGLLSRKQRRVSNSSGQAEAIAAITSVGCALNARTVWENITGEQLPITLVVDSLGLHKSLATQSQPTDMAVAADVHSLRLDYENKLIDAESWIEGSKNPVNPLTKPHAGESTRILEEMLRSGLLPCDVDIVKHYGPALREEQ